METICNVKECRWRNYVEIFDTYFCDKGYITINSDGLCTIAEEILGEEDAKTKL